MIELMEEKFGVRVDLKAIEEEVVLLYHEELDEELISEEVLKMLPNPVSFTHMYSMESQSGLLGLP
ncbi:hypothetical protein [Bacillus sp. LLTC93]|uniref:hypothetical protein n=1 Tax=Bacillus sp. LLTC93 TaxID=2108274 RepID=UPI001CB9A871|nr:hypothetical protein [Bacillus sp. LLTC93]